MATRQQILDDVDLRYRNSYTTAQKIVWVNEEERELFEILEIDSVPYSFEIVANQYFYPIPSGVEVDKIKTISIQSNNSTTDPSFTQLPFKRNDDNTYADEEAYWYTIVEDNFFINIPGGPVTANAGRDVYIYLDKEATEWNTSNLTAEPTCPKKYQEILKLGLLARIAAARKDEAMRNNYVSEREAKLDDIVWNMRLNEPEWPQPIDVGYKVGDSYGSRKVVVITQTTT
ncbi:phage adaptor protein [Paenibacillus alkalitolerans]|uniref:phage adaptor protein n=1 Tax=Paenibacillus alkalitolerans TaxID=2799335 RepID=UPI0018F5ACFF|nr:hypothetical protein [Paenibacillus alkalitolerans]